MAGNQEKGDVPEWTKPLKLKDPHLDMDFLLNPKNLEKINENITNRKGVGDIQALVSQKGNLRVGLWNYHAPLGPSGPISVRTN